MFRILFILLLLVPLMEVYVFIKVGSLLGALPTVMLCILTAMLGTWLFRQQGMQTIRRVQEKLSQGEMPATDLVEGFILLLAGILLLLPGFLSDIAGLICLIPGLRTRIATALLGKMLIIKSGNTKNQTVIVEGEFWKDDDKRLR